MHAKGQSELEMLRVRGSVEWALAAPLRVGSGDDLLGLCGSWWAGGWGGRGEVCP